MTDRRCFVKADATVIPAAALGGFMHGVSQPGYQPLAGIFGMPPHVFITYRRGSSRHARRTH